MLNLSLHIDESLEKVKLNRVLSLLDYMIFLSLERTAGLTCEELTKKMNYHLNLLSRLMLIASESEKTTLGEEGYAEKERT
jgi:hypothetical protein